MTRNSQSSLLFLLPLTFALAACAENTEDETTGGETTESGDSGDGDSGDGDGDGAAAELKVRGEFTDNWDVAHVISSTEWTVGSDSYSISAFDNQGEFVVAQNGSENAYDPGMWSRFDLAFVGNALYYCQTGYAEESEQAAMELERSDDSDPATTGCGGEFAWSQLSDDYLEWQGSWTDEWKQAYAVASDSVSVGTSTFAVAQYDSSADFLVAQNGSANEYNPDLWSRFDWTYVGNDLYVCQSAYDAADEQSAVDAPAADASDPANSGCGGDFAWSKLN